ncbi:MAG: hypothetical protein OES79_13740, partial [Planctomycetota bacterium]|nr:hypothetical protein [Planctomycetota bacterium]
LSVSGKALAAGISRKHRRLVPARRDRSQTQIRRKTRRFERKWRCPSKHRLDFPEIVFIRRSFDRQSG